MPAEPEGARRYYPEKQEDQETRNAFERDRDRLLYSTSFRRLAGITQVAAAHERALLHNRLTHSLKVAQIARRLAQGMIIRHPHLAEKIDPDVAETAGLAHDLGHPPFGHSSEGMLDTKLKGVGGFEGNAQSFRIVTKLAVRRQEHLGLNLTERSLAAILKYPAFQADLDAQTRTRNLRKVSDWARRDYGAKWGAYASESEPFTFARRPFLDLSEPERYQRTAEAIIMDWADDISFATHDLEDYFRAGLVPLDKIEYYSSRIEDYAQRSLAKRANFSMDRFREAGKQVSRIASFDNEFSFSRVDRDAGQAMVSRLISELSGGLKPLNSAPWVEVTPEVQYLAEYLKTITRVFVIDSPSTALAREGQVRLLDELFEILLEWLIVDRTNPRTPRLLREMLHLEQLDRDVHAGFTPDLTSTLSEHEQRTRSFYRRTVADYLCSLTETQVVDMMQRLSGLSSTSMFGAWF